MAEKKGHTGIKASLDIQLDRHEAKYIIHERQAEGIRKFIEPFCEADPYGEGSPPRYQVTTLQLDTFDYRLHEAKERELLNRFKLRVRTYGEPGANPVFLEIKQKYKDVIIKSRTRIPFEAWSEDLIRSLKFNLTFRSRKEEAGFLQFLRLAREIDARPTMLIRYQRESYFGRQDTYARVTFDRRLEYQATTSWDSWGRGGRWEAMDMAVAQDHHNTFSGVILELKTLSEAPVWMMDLVMQFGLERAGHCKYSTAVWMDSFFKGFPRAPRYAGEVLSW